MRKLAAMLVGAILAGCTSRLADPFAQYPVAYLVVRPTSITEVREFIGDMEVVAYSHVLQLQAPPEDSLVALGGDQCPALDDLGQLYTVGLQAQRVVLLPEGQTLTPVSTFVIVSCTPIPGQLP